MNEAELRRHLQEIHAELARADSVDPDSRKLLLAVMHDIQEVLERSNAPARRGRSLGERLAEAARHFEESHPLLASTIGRVADTLSNLGI